MKRPQIASLVVSLLAATVLLSGIGCGGGGGGSSSGGSSGNPGTRPNGSIFSEVIVGVSNGSTAARSLINLRTGDVVELESLALYTSPDGYEGGFYEDLTNITLNAPPSVATLVGTTLRAVGPGTGTITATGARGTTLTADVVVTSNLARVSGRVRTVQVGNANSGIATAVVRFFDAAGNEVASVPTGPDGRYVANIPTSAENFVADFSSLPNSFYNQFGYNGSDFSAGILGCGVALPNFGANSSLNLSDMIAYRKSSTTPPPPPPNGCGG